MLVKVLLQAANGKIIPLVLHGGSVVVDERGLHRRNKGIVAEAPLYHALADGGRADMAVLAPLINVELIKTGALVFAAHKLVVSTCQMHRRRGDITLNTRLPCDASSAAFIGAVQVLEAEYRFIRVVPGHAPGFLFLAYDCAPTVPGGASFFARHVKHRPTAPLPDGCV